MNQLFKRIIVASDHRGFDLKTKLLGTPDISENISIQDMGPQTAEPVDYPDFAKKACHAIDPEDMGLLICGTGIGMSISANRFPHVRAALCGTVDMAQKARAHNNANILVLGADIIEYNNAIAMIKTFMQTPFKGGRHAQRVEKIK